MDEIKLEDSDSYRWEINNSDIPSLEKLLLQTKAGDIVDEGYYIFYPSEEHRKKNLRWWINGKELKSMGVLSDVFKRHMDDLIWGSEFKGNIDSE